jgi:hypothetical protein
VSSWIFAFALVVRDLLRNVVASSPAGHCFGCILGCEQYPHGLFVLLLIVVRDLLCNDVESLLAGHCFGCILGREQCTF